MPVWLGILIIIVVFAFGVNYNRWLKQNRDCSAFTFWRAIGGVVDLFLLMATLNADSMGHCVILFLISATIFLLLFFVNYKDSKSVLHGILMTLWQLLIGGAIMWIWEAVQGWEKRRR